MNLTEEQLNEIESLAGVFMDPKDIMIILGLPKHQEERFIEILTWETENPIHSAYHRGRLKAIVTLRESIKQSALNGSNPAQIEMMKFFNNSKL